MYESIMQHTIN